MFGQEENKNEAIQGNILSFSVVTAVERLGSARAAHANKRDR